MDCSYCSTATIEGRIIRKHDPGKVVEAISKYADTGLDHFFFVDNTFNIPSDSKILYGKRVERLFARNS